MAGAAPMQQRATVQALRKPAARAGGRKLASPSGGHVSTAHFPDGEPDEAHFTKF
ncbi:hypothetical protein D3C72_2484480 [compost metagenome]